MESYIAYLDLLGTKNFSGDVETYTQNIQHFYDSINFCSALLKDGDIVAYFSDCSYIQTFSIKNMVDFLRYLREVLMSYNLFFNAAVIKGELDIKNDLDNSRVRGISFNNPAVSKVYLAQDNYKGAGIHLEDAVKEEIKKEEKLVKYLTKSIYLPGLDIQPKAYFDLKFDVKSDKNSQLEYQSTRCIFENALNACLKAKTFGKYYVATLATLINSFDEPALKWNLNKHEFTEAPLIYKVIFDIGKGEGNDNEKYKKIIGLDYLCFMIVEKAFHSTFNYQIKEDIIQAVMNFSFIQDKYMDYLESIPNIIEASVKKEIIQIYQQTNVAESVNKLISRLTNGL